MFLLIMQFVQININFMNNGTIVSSTFFRFTLKCHTTDGKWISSDRWFTILCIWKVNVMVSNDLFLPITEMLHCTQKCEFQHVNFFEGSFCNIVQFSRNLAWCFFFCFIIKCYTILHTACEFHETGGFITLYIWNKKDTFMMSNYLSFHIKVLLQT